MKPVYAIAGLLCLSMFAACPGPAEDETPTPTPTPEGVKFTVDLSKGTVGDCNMTAVKDGEKVYVVGNFTDWNPNNPDYELTKQADGTYAGRFVIAKDTELAFKFAKTASDTADAWSEGEKDYKAKTEADYSCAADPEAAGGLFEVANRAYTVKGGSEDAGTFVIDAWRETAEACSIVTCQ